jgi:hypothetical protein
MFPYNPCENNWLSETKKGGQVDKKPGHLLSGQSFVNYLNDKLNTNNNINFGFDYTEKNGI